MISFSEMRGFFGWVDSYCYEVGRLRREEFLAYHHLLFGTEIPFLFLKNTFGFSPF